MPIVRTMSNTTSVSLQPEETGAPLLLGNQSLQRSNARRQPLRDAARFLRRSSSRRVMRESSMLVRETAAEQLEERQSDWAYSKPIVILDILWNTLFLIAAGVVVFMSWNEHPRLPLRLWLFGYVAQCVLHVICVWIEYRRRTRWRWRAMTVVAGGGSHGSHDGSVNPAVSNPSDYVSLAQVDEEETSFTKHLESGNTMFSFIWWIIGFYWISTGGQPLEHDSPLLYWLCITFLGFDVLFVVFCVLLACVIGVAVCCCLPCIIAILYAVAEQEGASKEDIDGLPKFKFQRYGGNDKRFEGSLGTSGGIMVECDTDTPIEHALQEENTECCICISAYEDGAELRELPCGHHYHCACVDKWLLINATCPLCKHNIVKTNNDWLNI